MTIQLYTNTGNTIALTLNSNKFFLFEISNNELFKQFYLSDISLYKDRYNLFVLELNENDDELLKIFDFPVNQYDYTVFESSILDDFNDISSKKVLIKGKLNVKNPSETI